MFFQKVFPLSPHFSLKKKSPPYGRRFSPLKYIEINTFLALFPAAGRNFLVFFTALLKFSLLESGFEQSCSPKLFPPRRKNAVEKPNIY